jgi:hypothetical protein
MPELSVIICTHNPRPEFLSRVMAALKAQTLPVEKWEILMVDNASDPPLSGNRDLAWHSHGRSVLENSLGLTAARLRGIRESRTDLLVFVDDDNVLAADYLETAWALAAKHATLGAWSGQVMPEFETPPVEELRPYLGMLCLRELKGDFWSNAADMEHLPFGAGMCVRRAVAEQYARNVLNDRRRLALDRSGHSLVSCGDLDLALTSLDLNMGTGLFQSLVVTHLIPKRRLEQNYILQLTEDGEAGFMLLKAIHGLTDSLPASRIDRFVAQYKLWRATPMQKKIAAARERGRRRGLDWLCTLKTSHSKEAGAGDLAA